MMGSCKSMNSLSLGFHEADEHRRRSPHRRRSMHYLPGEALRIFAGPSPEKLQDGSPGHRDRLRLCTENLGSESCEGTLEPEEEAALEAAAADEDADREAAAADGKAEKVGDEIARGPVRWRRQEERRKFPPPLQWMANSDGRPTGFMKAAREGGRLILREVRIERPEVLCATREDGRLRLHLIEAEFFEEARREEEADETSPETAEEDVERWEWQKGEGLRRCQEAASGDREVPAWWNHRFPTPA